ncbi:hypothetical protein D3C72_2416590 [compost metagenome]
MMSPCAAKAPADKEARMAAIANFFMVISKQVLRKFFLFAKALLIDQQLVEHGEDVRQE